MNRRLRSFLAGTCGVLGFLLVLAGGLVAYASTSLLDSGRFSNHVAESLSDPRVASYAGDQIANAAVAENRDLIRIRPLIAAGAEVIVRSAPFRAVVRRAVRESHALFVSGGEILLTLQDVGLILRNAVSLQPSLAKRIPEDLTVALQSEIPGEVTDVAAMLVETGVRVRSYSRWAFVAGGVFFLLSVVISARPREAMFRVGLSLTLLATVMLFLVELSAGVVQRLFVDRELGAALAGVVSSFAAGLWPRALGLGGIGLLLLAGATAAVREADVWTWVRETFQRALRPGHRWARVLRGTVLVILGLIGVFDPQAAIRLLMMAVSGLLAFTGFQEIFRGVFPAAPELLESLEVERERTPRNLARRLVWATVGVGVIGLLSLALFSSSPKLTPVARATGSCNGTPGLCDKRLDEVVFAGTHNAMGAAAVDGWMFPNHERDIPRQLQDGIRALLFDVYSGVPVGNHVKTDIEGKVDLREKYGPMLGEQGVDAALRIRDRLIGGVPEDRALFLCHGLCEIGADPLVAMLKKIRDFLVLNPGEVLIIVIENAVPADALAEAFEESRLLDFVYRGPAGSPWPTLREMIERDERVLVSVERFGEGRTVPWIHPAFEVFQETPYHFTSVDGFSCEPNRGGTRGSLFQINHWVTFPPTSRPSDAVVANSYEVLMDRARSCQKERGKLPNVIAVDFYETGDLFRVVDELNRSPMP